VNYSSLPVLSGLLSGLKSFCSEPNQPKPATEIPPMNNKSITPSFQQPVVRFASGQLPSALAELSEAVLSSDVLPLSRWSGDPRDGAACSYDGSDD